MSKTPFTVPPFKPQAPKRVEPVERFFWWSWHPLYPYWSKSCWGAATLDGALCYREQRICSSLDVYHNKLIRENEGGTLTEVSDDPCRRLDVWERIHRQTRLAGERGKGRKA